MGKLEDACAEVPREGFPQRRSRANTFDFSRYNVTYRDTEGMYLQGTAKKTEKLLL